MQIRTIGCQEIQGGFVNSESEQDTVPGGKSPKGGSMFAWLYPLLIALVAAPLIKNGLIRYGDVAWRSSFTWLLYFGLYFACSWVFKKFVFKSRHTLASRHPALDWPVPGPIGKFMKIGQAVAFVGSSILSTFNPFQLVQQLRLTFGQISTSKRLAEKQEVIEQYQTKVSYRLPLDD